MISYEQWAIGALASDPQRTLDAAATNGVTADCFADPAARAAWRFERSCRPTGRRSTVRGASADQGRGWRPGRRRTSVSSMTAIPAVLSNETG